MSRVVVAGSGLGGLAVACQLASAGHRVLILEKEAELGGGLRPHTMGAFRVDLAPDGILLPQALAGLFASSGRRLADHLDLLPVEPAARIYPAEGEPFNWWTKEERLLAETHRLSPQDVRLARRTLRVSRSLYRGLSRGPWKRGGGGALATTASFFAPPSLLRLPRTLSPRSLAGALGGGWSSPAVRGAFAWAATELGASPLHAPAAAAWVYHALTHFGLWVPRGGLWGLAKALFRLLETLGVEARTGQWAREIQFHNGRVHAVVTGDNETIRADAVVLTGNPFPLLETLPLRNRFAAWRQSRWNRARKPMTRVGFLWICRDAGWETPYRTVALPADLSSHWRRLWDWEVGSMDPILTALDPVRLDDALAAEFAESKTRPLIVWADAPPPGDRWRWSEAWIQKLRERALRRLEGLGWEGLRSHLLEEEILAPGAPSASGNGRVPQGFGGPPLTSWRSMMYRLPNRHPAAPGVYFAGAWAHPGPLAAQVILGAERVARMISARASRS